MSKKAIKFMLGTVVGYIAAKTIWRGRKTKASGSPPEPVREG